GSAGATVDVDALRISARVTGGRARDAGEQGHRASSDAAHRRGSTGGLGGAGGAAEAGSSPGTCGSGEASDEWGWSDGASGRRRVGRSLDACYWRGDAQSAGGSLLDGTIVLIGTG